MPRRKQYVLPATGSAPLVIPATIWSRLAEISEDGANAQGIILFVKDDGTANGYTTPFNYSAAKQPVTLGSKRGLGKGAGPWVGIPRQMDQGGTVELRPGLPLCKATSATATPTTIDVAEYE